MLILPYIEPDNVYRFCDGSVKAIPTTTRLDVLTRLAVRNDGEVISGSDY